MSFENPFSGNVEMTLGGNTRGPQETSTSIAGFNPTPTNSMGIAGYNVNSNLPNPENVKSNIELLQDAAKKDRFIHQIGDQLYYIEVWLYNQIDGQEPFAVPFLFINSLAIEETLYDWNTKGWITFNNNFEILERGSVAGEEVVKAPYTFRTDGRNRLSIRLYPIPNDKSIISIGENPSNALPREKWEISLDCVIYDVEDLPVDNNHYKLKKCYFWDERYQFFLERNVEWSTAVQGLKTMADMKVGDNVENAQSLPDFYRSVPANIALKSLIDHASLVEPKVTNSGGDVIKIGYYDGYGKIDRPAIPLNSISPDWDFGPSDGSNMVFYTSPANSNVLDDMNYILKNAMSSNKSPVFLRFDRSSTKTSLSDPNQTYQAKEWELISLEKIFENAQNEQVERIFIEDGVETRKPYVPRAPANFSSDIQNFMSGIASRIKSYKFSPMVATDDNRISNKPLIQYDFLNGQFKIMSTENTAKSVLDKFTGVVSKGLYSFKQNKDAHIIMNLNQTKEKGIMHKNAIVTRPFVPSNLPQIEMMKDLLFLNQAVNFVANGLTIRSPGRFIFIDKASSGQNNPFDDRFLGQWLMTRVVHLFTKDNYVTEVVATKVDAFSRIWQTQDNKL